MKLTSLIFTGLLAATCSSALAAPQDPSLHASRDETSLNSHLLFPRKGGGGGGKGGGTSSSGSSSGSSGSSAGKGGGTSSSGSAGTRGGYGSSGGYYSGGAATPYRSGVASPRGLAPFFIAPVLLIGLYGAGAHIYAPYGAYTYNLPGNASFYNSTSMMNETLPVRCYCLRYAECSCDANDDAGYVGSLVGNGSAEAAAANGVARAQDNGVQLLLVNGTEANGTAEAATSGASGKRGVLGWSALTGWASTAGVVAWIVLG